MANNGPQHSQQRRPSSSLCANHTLTEIDDLANQFAELLGLVRSRVKDLEAQLNASQASGKHFKDQFDSAHAGLENHSPGTGPVAADSPFAAPAPVALRNATQCTDFSPEENKALSGDQLRTVQFAEQQADEAITSHLTETEASQETIRRRESLWGVTIGIATLAKTLQSTISSQAKRGQHYS